MLRGKHIVIGITGGIAAYKSLFLIRLFKSHGCEVRVVATRHALEFVTPLTIETLSQEKLYTDMFDPVEHRDVHHISLADWADCVVVAPATANIIGKYANGIADDALSTMLLALHCPLFIAPAMNTHMLANAAVQHNIDILRQRGCHIIASRDGFLACGTNGGGRMEEPEQIFQQVFQYFTQSGRLSGKRVLISAGPTYEPIDPVRFIGNHSSGRMGFALAEAAAEQGADVTLVTGPTALSTRHPGICRLDVTTAAEMFQACSNAFPDQDICIMSAAVADYTPENPAPEKIKKNSEALNLHLVKTRDILASLGQQKRDDQVLVGFALETENELENAKHKLHTKRADLIVLNSLRTEGAGFRTATNQVTMLTKGGHLSESTLKSKEDIAGDILDMVCKIMNHEVE